MERVRAPRNPGKPIKMAALPFFTYSFSTKTCGPLLQTFDAPSMARREPVALLVRPSKKWQDFLLHNILYNQESAAKKIKKAPEEIPDAFAF